ncbi:MAG: DNA-formamidopyrimidine glycosylase [Siphonobacter sp.]
MPELPEVETYRRYFEETCLNQVITDVYVEDTNLLTTDYDVLIATLMRRKFLSTRRVGKNLFAETDGGIWVHFHFGMTGDLAYFRYDAPVPRFARIIFSFQGGDQLAFICPRKFERIGLVEDVDEYLLKKKIARDALTISVEELATSFARKKVFIKAVLLDQSVIAGIGNWIVDEVLFRAGIHPERYANTLSSVEIEAIHEAIQEVLQTAIRFEANYAFFPQSYIIHAREWAISPYTDSSQHKNCPHCGKPLQVIRVGGRTTFFCPADQPIR